MNITTITITSITFNTTTTSINSSTTVSTQAHTEGALHAPFCAFGRVWWGIASWLSLDAVRCGLDDVHGVLDSGWCTRGAVNSRVLKGCGHA